jgi:hypothetical protein
MTDIKTLVDNFPCGLVCFIEGYRAALGPMPQTGLEAHIRIFCRACRRYIEEKEYSCPTVTWLLAGSEHKTPTLLLTDENFLKIYRIQS